MFAVSTGRSPDDVTGAINDEPVLPPELIEMSNALLATLSVVMNTDDPAAMASNLNAADAVSGSVEGALSPDGAEALVNVVSGFVDASQSSYTGDGTQDAQVTTAARVLSRGLDATILDGDDAAAETTSSDTAAAGSSSSSSRRRRVLLSGNDADTSSIDIPATFARVEGAASGLAGLLAASTPMGGAKLGGTPSMCMAVARDTPAGLQSVVVGMDCGAPAATGSRRRLLAAAPGGASVTLPTGLAAACTANPDCSTDQGSSVSIVYVADPQLTLGVVRDWPMASLVAGALADSQLTAVSGASKLDHDRRGRARHVQLPCIKRARNNSLSLSLFLCTQHIRTTHTRAPVPLQAL